jgi:hypothetical protein
VIIGRRAAYDSAEIEGSAALMKQREEGSTLTPFHDDEEVGRLEAGAHEKNDIGVPQLAGGRMKR